MRAAGAKTLASERAGAGPTVSAAAGESKGANEVKALPRPERGQRPRAARLRRMSADMPVRESWRGRPAGKEGASSVSRRS